MRALVRAKPKRLVGRRAPGRRAPRRGTQGPPQPQASVLLALPLPSVTAHMRPRWSRSQPSCVDQTPRPSPNPKPRPRRFPFVECLEGEAQKQEGGGMDVAAVASRCAVHAGIVPSRVLACANGAGGPGRRRALGRAGSRLRDASRGPLLQRAAARRALDGGASGGEVRSNSVNLWSNPSLERRHAGRLPAAPRPGAHRLARAPPPLGAVGCGQRHPPVR